MHVVADNSLFLGKDLIVWLLLALGAALFVGNVLALVRPPDQQRREGDLEQAPRARSLSQAVVGLLVALASLAALIVRHR